MASASLPQFDPEEHGVGVYEKFQDFVSRFKYLYDSLSRDPPNSIQTKGDEEINKWVSQDKRKVFLGKFATSNMQCLYEEIVPSAERTNLKFEDMSKNSQTDSKRPVITH